MGYIAGWNMPGYLPETAPEYFDEWTDARDYLMETIERFMDDDFDSLAWTRPEETAIIERSLNAKWDPVLTAMMQGEPFAAVTNNNDLSFWIIEGVRISEEMNDNAIR